MEFCDLMIIIIGKKDKIHLNRVKLQFYIVNNVVYRLNLNKLGFQFDFFKKLVISYKAGRSPRQPKKGYAIQNPPLQLYQDLHDSV